MKTIFKGIGRVCKAIWNLLSFTRQLVLNLIFLILVGALFFAFYQGDKDTETQPQPGALVLDLSGPIVEQKDPVNPVDSLLSEAMGKEPQQENVLFDIVEAIRAASGDNDIKGLVLNLQNMPETSLTKLRYIAKAITDFKQSGKPVYAYGDNFSQSQYYLASYADKVFMSPDGAILLTGYGSYTLYYKSLLEKLDVTTHVFRVGTYKSAIEPYIRDNMSDAAKEANTVWLNQLWQAYTSDVAKNRNIDAAELTPKLPDFIAALKSVDGDFAKLSVKLGLVDSLMTHPEMTQEFEKTFGTDQDHNFNQISYYDYLASLTDINVPSKNKIAVVIASGAIIDGPQRPGTTGGDTTAELLREARFDNNVKAVILRVDSPGGSAFASELIRNEVDALQKAGKPVVVSMSSVAASGGYWISSSADKIIANPTTITGSIGIFAVMTTFEKGLNKLGIYNDGVGTTPFAGVGVTRALPQGVGEIFQLGVDHGYQRFIGLVSKYRHMSLAQVDKIAQGRVWTGADAKRLGLVDELGDFDTAISAAVDLAKINDYQIEWMQQPLSPMEMFLQQFTTEARTQLLTMVLGDMPKAITPVTEKISADLTSLANFNDPKGQYAFCLNCGTFN
ncbi:TPA: signal peptide peptidase SppA [Photobacterium damselae]|uniref:Signal peptide peptidase SppA n=2 Tax=Photobacterium damselae TaxID=38293 RepID=A0ACD3SXT6_PHODM|nr:signal peptide peptidase SppA [Photobacterium damselae]EHA1081223.1 signal peptide peptidase SppA [Photobacterium damselae]KAB1182288.1 signal peptide peptidase SppA [Photobacterium damselae subsp. damselae]KAB1183665.1 signal peptide peptidase SppA [Photobacterium damselae subsp. damselae]MBA5684717.1 signal peptide peptidase SppA [Photobacterium damselae subsp. damselae]MBF7100711.1 signal peptide peptidase SppA [Photobacterium damselae]